MTKTAKYFENLRLLHKNKLPVFMAHFHKRWLISLRNIFWVKQDIIECLEDLSYLAMSQTKLINIFSRCSSHKKVSLLVRTTPYLPSVLKTISHGKTWIPQLCGFHIQISLCLALWASSAGTYTFTSMQTYHLNKLANCKKAEHDMLRQKKTRKNYVMKLLQMDSTHLPC